VDHFSNLRSQFLPNGIHNPGELNRCQLAISLLGDFSSDLSSSSRYYYNPSDEFSLVGFRVASLSSSAPPAVPEPSMMVIGMVFGLGGLAAKRRMKK
jgi:hypothetical protein